MFYKIFILFHNNIIILMHRKVPQTSLQMENESLKNIIDQYKRSVKSLDDEIELHKLSRGALDEQIQNERQ